MKVQTILVPIDFSDASERAYEAALMLTRSQEGGARVVLLHVLSLGREDGWRLLMETPDDIEAELAREAFAKLEVTRSSREHEGVEVALRVASGRIVDTTCEVAQEEGASLIVCGATNHSRLGAAILGTTAYAIASAGTLPTLIVPAEVPERFARILAPVDIDESAHLELEAAREWADELGAALEVAHAVVVPTMGGEAYLMGLHEIVPAYLESRRERLGEILSSHGLGDLPEEARHVDLGQPHHVIERICSQHDIDLVVIASRCRDHITSTMLGGTASRVLRQPPAPVLVLPMPSA